MGFLFCLTFKDAHVQTSLWHWLLCFSETECFEEQRGVHMWKLQRCLYFLFSSLCEIRYQEKCELVKIILGKPENNINDLTAFKNKAMLLHNKSYRIKAGSEVIYGNLLEILEGDFLQWTPRWCTKGFLFHLLIFSRFCFFWAKLFSPLHTLVLTKRLVCDVFMTSLTEKLLSGLTCHFEQSPHPQPVKLKQKALQAAIDTHIYRSLTECFLWSQSSMFSSVWIQDSKGLMLWSSNLITSSSSLRLQV